LFFYYFNELKILKLIQPKLQYLYFLKSFIQTFKYDELPLGSHTEGFRSVYGIKTSRIP